MTETTTPLQTAPTANRLTIANRTDADEATLVLSGDIDFASSPTLETELQKAENALPGRIVLNLAALKFIDSTGIHLLAHAQQRADAAAHRLVLTHVPPHARRLFSLTGIDARVSIE
jgi:anti-anti-sigma factor